MDKSLGISRRTILRSVPVAAALIAAEGLPAPRRAFAGTSTFPQPALWVSDAPEVDWEFDVRFTHNFVPGLGRTFTRTYNGMIPGPTLRLRRGDTMRLTQVNGLPPNKPAHGDHNIPHNFNTFNLHTHGLHVSPSGEADNIFREFSPRADAESDETSYLSTIAIPGNHPAGTFWYHPHNHGSVSMQLAGGMAGVLIIEGDVDHVPEIEAAADVVVCINELKIHDGEVPDFTADSSLFSVPSTFTVNGVVNPVITLRPGEVQRWRLVAATGFTRLALRTDGAAAVLYPEMYQIAQDGVTFSAPVRTAEVRLAMGNRADVLVRAMVPGEYRLSSGDLTLMTIVVEGEPIEPPMSLPTELPPGKPPLSEDEVTDPTFHRRVEFAVDRNVFDNPKFPHAYRILGTNPTPALTPSADPVHDPRYGRFDPDFVNHTLRLGEVERWVIGPMFGHPFHLHTNHFLVIRQNGVDLDPPVWQDTISATSETEILVRYEDFTGPAVLHCHVLPHEDLGMMQVIDYVEG